jgi:hypothetical protein
MPSGFSNVDWNKTQKARSELLVAYLLRRYIGHPLHPASSIGGAPEIIADISAKSILRLPKLALWQRSSLNGARGTSPGPASGKRYRMQLAGRSRLGISWLPKSPRSWLAKKEDAALNKGEADKLPPQGRVAACNSPRLLSKICAWLDNHRR